MKSLSFIILGTLALLGASAEAKSGSVSKMNCTFDFHFGQVSLRPGAYGRHLWKTIENNPDNNDGSHQVFNIDSMDESNPKKTKITGHIEVVRGGKSFTKGDRPYEVELVILDTGYATAYMSHNWASSLSPGGRYTGRGECSFN